MNSLLEKPGTVTRNLYNRSTTPCPGKKRPVVSAKL